MRNPLSKSLLGRLILYFFCVGALPVALLGDLAFVSSRTALKRGLFAERESIRDIKADQVKSHLKKCFDDLTVLADTIETTGVSKPLVAFHDAQTAAEDETLDPSQPEFRAAIGGIKPFFQAYQNAHRHRKLLYLCAKHGRVLYSTDKQSDLGMSLRSGEYRKSGLADLWVQVKETGSPRLVDCTVCKTRDEPALYLGCPVINDMGQTIGIVVMQLPPEELDSLMAHKARVGQLGDSYLANEQGQVLAAAGAWGASTIPEHRLKPATIKAALEGDRNPQILENDLGQAMLTAYGLVGLKEEFGTAFDWIIVSEISETEALAPISALAFRIGWISVLLAIFATLAGYLTARSIIEPVRRIVDQVSQLGRGDLSIQPGGGFEKRRDEVGRLAKAVRATVESLRAQVCEIKQASEVIATSGNEISNSVAEVTRGTSETATAMNETTATVEQLKQAAEVGSQKAQRVTERAKDADTASENGKQAAQQISEVMEKIRRQMDAIGQSVVNLSEHSEAIGEIIAAVDEIADQSHLLSVNAAVEAAKAGEHGKGFAVVAQEIKNLAQQSKESTRQVRAILADIQKATGTTVMAAEQGCKAVEEGSQQANEASTAIRMLTDRIREAIQAATQIAISNREQLTGVEQVTYAMRSVKDATRQNVDSMQQLETASSTLRELSDRLRELTQHWKV